MEERKTKILRHLEDPIHRLHTIPLQQSDITILLKIIEENSDAKLRRNAAVCLGHLASSETIPSGEINRLKELYSKEKNILVATELLRVLNKGKMKARLGTDLSRSYDRKLSQNEQGRIEDELNRFRILYDDSIGKKGSFDSNYKIEAKIAEGGMSRIYKGTRRTDGADVAIKFLLEKFFNNKGVVARFHRESEILLRMDHPNIVKIYERGEHAGKYFIIMEYIEEGSLDQLIGKPSLSFDLSVSIIRQICRGLEFVHQNGIIHRDIKPGNVLLKWLPREGRNHDIKEIETTAKLADFGLAKDVIVDDFTKEYTAMGTPNYISPEQRLNPKVVDARTDIYSLGIMMYEIFSGGSYPIGDYKKIHEINPDIPATIDTILEKCKKERPAERWNSAKDIYDALNLSY